MPFTVSLDLTKRRYEMLKFAREATKDNPKVSYVFADINCSLVVKSANGNYFYFTNESEFNDVVANSNTFYNFFCVKILFLC